MFLITELKEAHLTILEIFFWQKLFTLKLRKRKIKSLEKIRKSFFH